jgi:AraC-like DNA-binding protein
MVVLATAPAFAEKRVALEIFHGAQVDGTSYPLLVDADIQAEDELAYEAVPIPRCTIVPWLVEFRRPRSDRYDAALRKGGRRGSILSARGLFIGSVIFFGSGFSFVLALGQIVRSRREDNLLLAACFALIALWQFLGACVYAGFTESFPFSVYALSIPCYYSSIPLLYFYFRHILGEAALPRRGRFLHATLPLLSIVASLPLARGDMDLYAAMNLIDGITLSPREALPVLSLYSAALLFFAYEAALLSKISGLRRDAVSRPRRLIDVTLALIAFVGLLNLWWLFDRALSLGTLPFIYASFTVFLVAIYLVSIRYPEYMFEIRKEAERVRYARSRLKGVDVDDTVTKLESILRKERAYLDPEIGLNDLAERLGLTPHQLSEIINDRLGKSFFSLVGGYRIEYAKRALAEHPERKVVDIAFDAGFNTQSAFYNAFKRQVGMSPSAYRASL